MSELRTWMESGVLELYVLGQASPAEIAEVERMSAIYPEVATEMEAITGALDGYASSFAMEPDPTIEPFLMATIDYMERMRAGEKPTFPPMLHADSLLSDYAEWTERPDMQLETMEDDAFAKIIGYTPEMTTAIVWLRRGAPPETHTNELEQFLVLEGTCNIVIDGEVHSMKPGDVLTIPLYKTHYVQVTSDYPCKVILQRMAA